MDISWETCNLSKTSVCDQKMVFMLSRVKKININLGKASVSCVWDLYLIFKLQIVQFKNKSGQKIKKNSNVSVWHLCSTNMFFSCSTQKIKETIILFIFFLLYHCDNSIKRKIMPKICFDYSFLTPVTHWRML